MRAWQRVGLILAASLSGGQIGNAQQSAPSPAALAVAERLVHASGFDRRIIVVPERPSDVSIVAECAANAASHPSEKIDCEANLTETHQLLKRSKALRAQQAPNLLRAAVNAYAAHLSIDDMQMAAAFFESQAGQHLLAASPAIATDYQAENETIMKAAVLAPRKR